MAGIYDIVIVGSLIATGYFVLTSGVLENIQIGGVGGDTGGLVGGDTGGITTGDTGNTLPTEESGGSTTDIKIDTTGKTSSSGGKTTFTCTSYPNCNSVSGTDARKSCCCKNKCSLMGRTGGTMKSGDICSCGPPKTSTTTTTPKPCNIKCTGCYVRGSGCTCKIDPNKLRYNDGVCTVSCGGRACWYNKPCGGSSKVKLCVTGDCTKARAAWLAKYACKPSTKCPYTGCTGLNKGATCFSCRCSKLCASKGGVKTVKADGSCFCKSSAAFVGAAQAINTYKYSDNNNIPYAYLVKQQKHVADIAISV